jgi:23S rRNA pseudouridine2605 synthase
MNAPADPPTYRLNRYLARAGLGSRRGVEELIASGRVRVDGEVVRDLACRVDPRRQRVTVDGRAVRLPAGWTVYAFHKPAGVVSTLRAQAGQEGLGSYRRRAGLPAGVVPVGRLDAETTGLLLWTDDGDLAQGILRPSSRVWKRYLVTLDAVLDAGGARRLAGGQLALDGRLCLPLRLEPGPGAAGRSWDLRIHEGRKRQIRRMFELLGRRVVSLARVAVGPVSLGRLAPGRFRRLTESEVRRLRAAAGLDDPETGER